MGPALVLTVVMDADRTGQTYDAPIVPDAPMCTNFGRAGLRYDPGAAHGLAGGSSSPPAPARSAGRPGGGSRTLWLRQRRVLTRRRRRYWSTVIAQSAW